MAKVQGQALLPGSAAWKAAAEWNSAFAVIDNGRVMWTSQSMSHRRRRYNS
jgi:hypothetical protein